MKLDPTYLQYISKEELRVLVAVEMGMRNHEYVPLHLIERISHLKKANAYKILQLLLKNKLIFHVSVKYDGYKLTYLGYDYLALYTFMKRGLLKTVLGKMGVGKESDIYRCVNNENEIIVLKLARLGRISFRTIKNNRDYLQNKTNYNWLYLSRLASVKEFGFMQILYNNGFPTPKPIDSNRHGILMSYIDGFPLSHVREMAGVPEIYTQCIELLKKFYQHGLIHSDYNEFNLMIDQDIKIRIIDFPQTISISHPNSDFYLERDYNCVQLYFKKRFDYEVKDEVIDFKGLKILKRLDMEVKASGFLHKELEENINALNILDDYEKLIGKQGAKEEEPEGDSDDEEVNEGEGNENNENSKEEEMKDNEKEIINEDLMDDPEVDYEEISSDEGSDKKDKEEVEEEVKNEEKVTKEKKGKGDEKEFIKNAVKQKYKKKFKTNQNHVKAKGKLKAVDYFF